MPCRLINDNKLGVQTTTPINPGHPRPPERNSDGDTHSRGVNSIQQILTYANSYKCLAGLVDLAGKRGESGIIDYKNWQ